MARAGSCVFLFLVFACSLLLLETWITSHMLKQVRFVGYPRPRFGVANHATVFGSDQSIRAGLP